jgi:hypothetical protein
MSEAVKVRISNSRMGPLRPHPRCALREKSMTEVDAALYDEFKDTAVWLQWCKLGYVGVRDPRARGVAPAPAPEGGGETTPEGDEQDPSDAPTQSLTAPAMSRAERKAARKAAAQAEAAAPAPAPEGGGETTPE